MGGQWNIRKSADTDQSELMINANKSFLSLLKPQNMSTPGTVDFLEITVAYLFNYRVI